MDNQAIIDQLKTILAQDMDLNLRREQIDDSVSFLDDGLSLDSISLAEFIDLLETRFAIRIHDEDLDSRSFGSLAGVVALVRRRLDAPVAEESLP